MVPVVGDTAVHGLSCLVQNVDHRLPQLLQGKSRDSMLPVTGHPHNPNEPKTESVEIPGFNAHVLRWMDTAEPPGNVECPARFRSGFEGS
jgi:hypothetical protein